MNAHSSFILETGKTNVHQQVNEPIEAYSHHGIKESRHTTTWVDLMPVEKPDSEENILYDSIFFGERQKRINSVRDV